MYVYMHTQWHKTWGHTTCTPVLQYICVKYTHTHMHTLIQSLWLPYMHTNYTACKCTCRHGDPKLEAVLHTHQPHSVFLFTFFFLSALNSVASVCTICKMRWFYFGTPFWASWFWKKEKKCSVLPSRFCGLMFLVTMHFHSLMHCIDSSLSQNSRTCVALLNIDNGLTFCTLLEVYLKGT